MERKKDQPSRAFSLELSSIEVLPLWWEVGVVSIRVTKLKIDNKLQKKKKKSEKQFHKPLLKFT